MAVIPSQRQRCEAFEWCTATARGHRSHVGEAHILSAAEGTQLRVSITAEDDRDPVVHIEAAFAPGEPLLELTELDPAEAVELASSLLRLARIAQGSRRSLTQNGP